MISGDKNARKIFVHDFENTYKHLEERSRITKEEAIATGEATEGKEQIQLIPSGDGTSLSPLVHL